MKKIFTKKTIDYIIGISINIVAGFFVALAINLFITPNGFLSTGFTGISIVAGRLYDKIAHSMNPDATSLQTKIAAVLYIILNTPLMVICWIKLSRKFTILTISNVLVTTLCMAFIPEDCCEWLNLSCKSGDISLMDAAIFAGALGGLASALSFYGGGSAGGVDCLSAYFSTKKQSTVGKVNMILNAFVIVAGMAVQGDQDAIKLAIYTLIYVVIYAVVIDLVYSRNKKVVLNIITTKGEEISKCINEKFVRGVTMMDATGTYTHANKQFLYCACLSFEVKSIITIIKQIDNHAFVTVLEVSKIFGNFIPKEIK